MPLYIMCRLKHDRDILSNLYPSEFVSYFEANHTLREARLPRKSLLELETVFFQAIVRYLNCRMGSFPSEKKNRVVRSKG